VPPNNVGITEENMRWADDKLKKELREDDKLKKELRYISFLFFPLCLKPPSSDLP
jgi:hypothetical protein